MNIKFSVILTMALLALVAGWFIHFMYRRLYKSTDPGALFVKWIITIPFFALWIYLGLQAKSAGWGGAFMIPAIAAGSGIILAIIWAPHIAAIFSSPLTKLYDGGDEEPELRPLYSIATAHRKRGHYDKAVAEIRRQLANFPEDYQGWMMLAEVQADDLKDLEAALQTVDYLLTLPGLPAKNIAFALGRVADWQLRDRSDIGAAREALRRVTELIPDTVEAQLAEQRIAHLASPEDLADQHEPRVIALKHHEARLGLMDRVIEPPSEETPSAKAKLYLDHLRDYPLDNDARERLAVLYADEFKRLDLAANELEELITRPNQLPKHVVHWLNLLVDFQVRLTGDVSAARATLQRIIDLYPNSAAASNAQTRLSQLRLELKQGAQQRTIKLGSYEQNIGLRKMSSSGQMQNPPPD